MKNKIKKLLISTLNLILVFTLSITSLGSSMIYVVTNRNAALTNNTIALANTSTEAYVYLSDLTNTKIVSKSVAYNEFYIDKNEPGNLISLIVNGEKTPFLKGLFAHAPSTVIYDISEYTAKGYDTFSAYLGVDSYAGSSGNGVKFTISVSDDNVTWDDIKTNNVTWTDIKASSILKGDTEAEKISVPISGYKYLKLYASNNGDDTKDHAVYADAKIYDSSKYTPKAITTYDWIKKVADYDADIKGKTDVLTNNKTRLALLQRTLVYRVDYSVLQAWVNNSSENEEVLNWLFNDVDILEEYILGGTPEGGSYTKSLDVLAELYSKRKDDIKGNNIEAKTLRKLMFATSLTHSTTISSWFSGYNGAKVYSTGLGRYDAIKQLYLGAKNPEGKWEQKTNDGKEVPYEFEWEQFQDLSVEEMRWVTINNLSDEEFLWLNWYATITKMGYTDYSGLMNPNDLGERNPYLYINYGDGGNVGREEYYKFQDHPMCGEGNEFYDENGRKINCYEKYQLNHWESLKTTDRAKPTLWIAFEEDGVCGTLMHVGANLQRVFGIPATGLGQPGHGAYIFQKRVKVGEHYTTQEWTTYNWVSDWDESEKGERLLLNWGTRNKSTVFNSTYNLIYIPLAQNALNEFDKYRESELYMMMADVETTAAKKEEYYLKALDVIPYHITAWYNLLTLKVNNEASSSELNRLGQDMMSKVGNAPMAIEELSNIIKGSLGDQIDSYKLRKENILTTLKDLPNSSDAYMNVHGVKAVAARLLNQVGYKAPASFSFEDNILRLESEYATRFEYSLNYNSYSLEERENNQVVWKQVSGKTVDLTSELANITPESDIAVHLVGDAVDNVYIIDITKAATPKNLYANDLENKVIGATNTMEWKVDGSSDNWTKFTDETKFPGQQFILVRQGATGTMMASDSVRLSFAVDPEADPTKSYISIGRLKATASSQQNNTDQKADLAVDGNPNTFWHNNWGGEPNGQKPWIQIEITDGPVELSKIDYVPRPGGGNGNYTIVKIEVSLDGVNFDTIEESYNLGGGAALRSYYFETPVEAKYVRLTAIDSVNGFGSAAMINLYENTEPNTISVDDLQVSYMSSGFIYNGEAKKPPVTVKYKDKELINGEDYTLSYEDYINAGTGKIILTGLGIYDGTRTLEYTISKAKEPPVMPEEEMIATVDQDTLSALGGLPEGWSWENPNTRLKAGETIEATAIYKDQKNYEIYKVTIKVTQDKGNRPEVKLIDENTNLTFDISQDGDTPMTLEDLISLVSISDIEDDADGVPLKVETDTDWDKDWNKEGTYHIKFIVEDSDGNVTEFTLEFTLVNPKTPQIDLETLTITIEEGLVYNGQELIPNITITDSEGHILKEGTDYVLEFTNNKNAGTATVTITANGELYTGEITKTFTIEKAETPEVVPDSISITSDVTSLSEINLPDGWSWKDASVELTEGENKITIIYQGDENHKRFEVEITVIKEKAPEVENPDEDNEEDDNKKDDDNKEEDDKKDDDNKEEDDKKDDDEDKKDDDEKEETPKEEDKKPSSGSSSNNSSNSSSNNSSNNSSNGASNNNSNASDNNSNSSNNSNENDSDSTIENVDKEDNSNSSDNKDENKTPTKEENSKKNQEEKEENSKKHVLFIALGIISLLFLLWLILFIILKRREKREE